MEKKILPFLAVLFLLAATANASSVATYTTNDTYIVGAVPLGLQPTVNLSLGQSFFKFNTTNANAHLWTHVYFQMSTTSIFCNSFNGCWKEIRYVNNNSWDERTLINTNIPYADTSLISGIAMSNSAGNKTSMDFMTVGTDWLGGGIRSEINRSFAINKMYDDEIVTLNISPAFYSPGSTFGGANDTIWSWNGNDASAAMLNFTVVDFINGTVTNTDMTDWVFFDFETGFNSTSSAILYDFGYAPYQNALFPNFNNPIPSAIAAASTGLENDLDTAIQICSGGLSSYAADTKNPNPIPGTYNYYCFNLTSTHNNQKFWGIIKVLNNTNVRGNASQEFDYYWAIASPNYISFTSPLYFPDPPIVGVNLSVETATTNNVYNTTMFFRFNSSGTFSPWGSVMEEAGGNPVDHDFTLNNQFVTVATYQIYFTGVDSTGTNHTSPTFTFNVTGAYVTPTTNTTLANAVQSLTDGGWFPTLNEGYYFVGAIILVIMTIVGFAAGGLKGAVVAASGGIIVLGLGGLLPIYVFIPVVVVVVAFIAKIVIKIFGSDVV